MLTRVSSILAIVMILYCQTSLVSASTSAVTMTPEALSFGNVEEGTRSALQTVTLYNGSNLPAAVYSIWIGWSYSQTNNCGPILPAGGSCAIYVTFVPLMTGTIQEKLVVNASSISF